MSRGFWGWVGGILERFDSGAPQKKKHLLTARELGVFLRQEYSRASRYGYPLSLIMYDMRDQGRALQLDETRENRVVERIRSSDRIGWYDEKHLAVVLPHTKGNDARKLGSDLISRLRMPHMKKNTRPTLSYSVYTFPLDDKTEYADRVPFLEHLG